MRMLAGIFREHDLPVLLHEQHFRARPVHRDAVNAVADLGIRVGYVLGLQSLVDRPPRLAGVVGTEGARSRDGDVHPLGVARIEKDRVQTHPTGAWLPAGPRAVAPQSRELSPCLPAVSRAKYGSVFNPGVDRVRIGERRFQMPDSLELPGVRRAIVPLVRAGDAFVDEFVTHRLPRLATVVRALDQLPKPTTALRRIQPILVSG